MSLPHWFGYRTTDLPNGDVALVGRAWHGYGLVILFACVGLVLPWGIVADGATARRAQDAIAAVLLLGALGLGSAAGMMWWFAVERTVLLSHGGTIGITDRMMLRRTSRTVLLTDVVGLRCHFEQASRAIFKTAYLSLRLRDGDAVALIGQSAQMYEWQSRPALQAIERYLARQGVDVPFTVVSRDEQDEAAPPDKPSAALANHARRQKKQRRQ